MQFTSDRPHPSAPQPRPRFFHARRRRSVQLLDSGPLRDTGVNLPGKLQRSALKAFDPPSSATNLQRRTAGFCDSSTGRNLMPLIAGCPFGCGPTSGGEFETFRSEDTELLWSILTVLELEQLHFPADPRKTLAFAAFREISTLVGPPQVLQTTPPAQSRPRMWIRSSRECSLSGFSCFEYFSSRGSGISNYTHADPHTGPMRPHLRAYWTGSSRENRAWGELDSV